MKILKIFGIVAGIHAVALLLIFANPGCSSTSKQPPAPIDTSTSPPPASPLAAPVMAPITPAPAASAPAAQDPGAAVFYRPTRPNTPAAEAVETQPVADVTPATTYVVGRNESLYSIAKKNHLKVADLAAANHLKPRSPLHQGQKLLIPARAAPDASSAPAASAGDLAVSAPSHAASPASLAAAPSAPPAAGTLKHRVQSGETLGSIARKYHVRVGDLATVNAISDPAKIHPGQELVIPAGGHAKGTPAPTPTIGAGTTPSTAGTPVIGQDLNAGLKPASESDVPVIKIESTPDTSSPSK